MWSQGNFRSDGADLDDMAAFAAKAAELGFGHIEINYVIPHDGVEILLANGHVRVSSVHSPCPRIHCEDGRHSENINLASTDEAERALAVQYAKDSVDTAARAGTSLLVVHLGGVGDKMFEEERELRRLYDANAESSPHDIEESEGLRKVAMELRREGAGAYFPQAKRSLAEIAEHAAAKGVTIGLENRYHYSEFPDPDEMAVLIADYPPNVVGFWLDIGHAEVLDRLGFIDHRRWLDELGNRCVGSHVHDVEGLADHRAPGHGTADWPHYAEKLPPHIPRVFEINQRTPPELVANGIPFLRQVGVLPHLAA
jgi:sugar phosphate isomerase/epimerase